MTTGFYSLGFLAREVLKRLHRAPIEAKGTAPFHAKVEVVSPIRYFSLSPDDFGERHIVGWVSDLLAAPRAAPRTAPMRLPEAYPGSLEFSGALEKFDGMVCRMIRQYRPWMDQEVLKIDLEYRPSSEGQKAEAA